MRLPRLAVFFASLLFTVPAAAFAEEFTVQGKAPKDMSVAASIVFRSSNCTTGETHHGNPLDIPLRTVTELSVFQDAQRGMYSFASPLVHSTPECAWIPSHISVQASYPNLEKPAPVAEIDLMGIPYSTEAEKALVVCRRYDGGPLPDYITCYDPGEVTAHYERCMEKQALAGTIYFPLRLISFSPPPGKKALVLNIVLEPHPEGRLFTAAEDIMLCPQEQRHSAPAH